ncbi:MAG: RNA methyltransferase [Clostridia bacterium]|nr:RNA methyltransferase [Clostridia bacterium]
MKEFKKISSRENSLIKLICALQSSAKARKENGSFVLEGLRICTDAYENSIRFDKLIVSQTAKIKYSEQITGFSECSEECYELPDSLFKKISDTATPQGVIAVSRIKDLSATEIDLNGRYIALENVADPSNLGAISRTAEALGVTGIILSSGGCDPYSPKALRASMGTLLRMPLIILEDFSNCLPKLGLKSFACVVDNTALSINGVRFDDGSVIIIGNEANGITEETKRVATQLITIPMNGKAESLNAAVAASISMWEMMK